MEEKDLALVDDLEKKLKVATLRNGKYYNYYFQNLSVPDFGVTTPPKLRNIKQLLGWPTMAVDVVLERINFTGFYSPRREDKEIIDQLNSIYRQNFFETEQKASQKDAFITGAAYVSVGTGDPEAGEPAIIWRSESPTQCYGIYDQRGHKLVAVFKMELVGETTFGTLSTAEKIITLSRKKRSREWNFVSEQENPLGAVPYVFIGNDADSQNPLGRSEITPAIRSLTDSGQRTLMDAETIRTYFTQPIRAIAGMNYADFFNADGSAKSIYDLVAGGIINLPFDPVSKQMPQLQELTTSSPTDVMQQLENYGRMVAREIGVPPSYMGFETVNPSSAEAINEADKKLILKAKARIPVLARAYLKLAKMTLDLMGVDADTTFFEATFARPESPTPAANADRISKMKAMGIFDQEYPDFVYRDLDFTQVDVLELKEWFQQRQGDSLIASLLAPATQEEIDNNGNNQPA